MADGGEQFRRMSAGAVTSVPQWSANPPELDPAARAHVLIGVGDEGAPVAAAWQQAVRRSVNEVLTSWRGPVDDEQYEKCVRDTVSGCRVGDRVALAGPEADVMRLRAQLLGAGFLDEELVVHATSSAELRVHCVHCQAVSRVSARPGDLVRCESCDYDLLIQRHFSPRLACYLGVRADAEFPR